MHYSVSGINPLVLGSLGVRGHYIVGSHVTLTNSIDSIFGSSHAGPTGMKTTVLFLAKGKSKNVSSDSRWISPAWDYLHGITTSTKQHMKRYCTADSITLLSKSSTAHIQQKK